MKMVFTYGTSGHPYVGGWTEIVAPTTRMCFELFRAYHPDKTPGILNCAFFYTWNDFKDSPMAVEGNFGAKRHEKITVTRIRTNPYRKTPGETDGD